MAIGIPWQDCRYQNLHFRVDLLNLVYKTLELITYRLGVISGCIVGANVQGNYIQARKSIFDFLN
jgi:hypothetical protein